jgi:hypothetical protein
MRSLFIAVLGLIFIPLVFSCSSKTISQTDNQSIEVPQTVTIIPSPVQPPIEVEQQVDTPAKHGLPPPVFPKEKKADPTSLDYQSGYRVGYNDSFRGYGMVEGWHSTDYKQGYYDGYSKGSAEREARQQTESMKKKYPPH